MHRLEREAMQPNIFTCSHIVRYVDDVLCLWTGGFLAHLNNLYLSIKFSLEIGEDSIPFLDVRVTLHHGSHKFEVYRKPTTNHLSVSNESFCHPRNKISGPSSMIHRLVSLPLEPPAFHKELSTIKYLARWNGNGNFNTDRLVQWKLMALALDSIAPLPCDNTSTRREKCIQPPYLGRFTSGQSRILKGYNFCPVFYNTSTLCHLFPSPKDPTPKFSKSGVYKLSCPDCTSVYIGETRRTLGVCLKEHKMAYTTNQKQKKSSYAHDWT